MSRIERKLNGRKDRIYPFYVLVLLIAIVVIWIMVFIKVGQYENGSTKHLMQQVISNLEEEYGGEITYRRNSSTDGGILYDIYQDDEMLATAMLNEREEKGMLGFSLYDIGEIKGAKSLSILALSNEKAKLGDSKVSDLKVSGEGIYLPALEALANHKTNTTCKVPKYNTYVLDEQFVLPKVTGDDVLLLDTDEGTLIAHEMSKARKEELKAWTEDFFNRYTYYVVSGKEFENIADDIFYTSPIYNTVAKFRYLWDYYYNYEIEMKEFKFSDFIQYTDDIVSLRVQYHYTQSLGRSKLDNRPDMNVYLYFNEGRWQIIEMEISEWTE